MEFSHGKSWSAVSLILGFVTLLLFYYGDVFAIFGMFIGFMTIVFMSAMYFSLYLFYEEEISRIEKKERKELLDSSSL